MLPESNNITQAGPPAENPSPGASVGADASQNGSHATVPADTDASANPASGAPSPPPATEAPSPDADASEPDTSDADAAETEAGTETSEAPSAGESPAAAPKEKKRRRRRRGKKAHPTEGPGANPEAAASDAQGAANGEAQESPALTESGQQAKTKSGKRPAKDKRGKKARPRQDSAHPRERTAFHVGEEVFGKVTSVTEHAIMVDLSGKALAIFDRLELAADDLVPEVSDRFVAHVHGDGSRGGFVVLTRKPLRGEGTKPKL